MHWITKPTKRGDTVKSKTRGNKQGRPKRTEDEEDNDDDDDHNSRKDNEDDGGDEDYDDKDHDNDDDNEDAIGKASNPRKIKKKWVSTMMT